MTFNSKTTKIEEKPNLVRLVDQETGKSLYIRPEDLKPAVERYQKQEKYQDKQDQ